MLCWSKRQERSSLNTTKLPRLGAQDLAPEHQKYTKPQEYNRNALRRESASCEQRIALEKMLVTNATFLRLAKATPSKHFAIRSQGEGIDG
jgi:hypothetical protein